MEDLLREKRVCRQLSIVVPVFNEVEVLPLLWERMTKVLDELSASARVIFVDDGSTDASLSYLMSLADKDHRAAVLSFSRNFGHQAAIAAGLEWSVADAAVIIDADLQDPPELIAEMVSEYENGYDVVYAQRRSRSGETIFKRLSAHMFYRVMRFLAGKNFPANVGTFRLMSSAVVKRVSEMREQHRFLHGMVAWVGFAQKAVSFDRERRAAGETKFGVLKMFRYAWSAIASFSAFPVRGGLWVGTCLLLASVLYIIHVLYVKFYLKTPIEGWASIVVLQLVFFGLIFFYLGIIGDYIGRIYEEGKRRPLYIVKLTKNIRKAEDGASSAL